ncbi:hypothetical protein EMCG_04851 [[Emmonsia] crescens]|uniref:Uncharacterized protein n=1 Tax=[Emmonsia] crescens TaxID=73230 RepID=A0A0G2HQW2_9EURO|nr:hypothetical protein EMCG_04851 [Emmonsia crescens UAMH 3008]
MEPAGQDFMICAHLVLKTLHLATGGSLHGLKYMPIIDKYINWSVDGILSGVMVDRWPWDSEGSDGACMVYAPAKEADLQLIVGNGGQLDI